MEITTITNTREGQLIKITAYDDNDYIWVVIYANKEKHGINGVKFEILIEDFKKIIKTINTLEE